MGALGSELSDGASKLLSFLWYDYNSLICAEKPGRQAYTV